MSISVLILTLNEEAILPACLQAVRWSDDIVLFDSFSSDHTVEIARSVGARVIQRRFDNERAHRAASLHLPFRHRWVYNPDADEITPTELRDEMQRAVQDAANPNVAYRVRFKTMFHDRWIRHSSLYPTWVMRLFRPKHISLQRSVNLHYVAHGPEGRLRSHFEHRTFNKGIAAWVEKHNRYSSHEAVESLCSLSAASPNWQRLFDRSPVVRREALKQLSFRLPCRPTLRFLYMYLLRRGWLDGSAGLEYCLLLSFYEQMIVLKMRELRQTEPALGRAI